MSCNLFVFGALFQAISFCSILCFPNVRAKALNPPAQVKYSTPNKIIKMAKKSYVSLKFVFSAIIAPYRGPKHVPSPSPVLNRALA